MQQRVPPRFTPKRFINSSVHVVCSWAQGSLPQTYKRLMAVISACQSMALHGAGSQAREQQAQGASQSSDSLAVLNGGLTASRCLADVHALGCTDPSLQQELHLFAAHSMRAGLWWWRCMCGPHIPAAVEVEMVLGVTEMATNVLEVLPSASGQIPTLSAAGVAAFDCLAALAVDPVGALLNHCCLALSCARPVACRRGGGLV